MLSATAKKTPVIAPFTVAAQVSPNTISEESPPLNTAEATPEATLKRANRLHHAGDVDAAYAIYLALLAEAENPQKPPLKAKTHAQVLSLIGTVHLQRNQFVEAKSAYEKALTFNANDASTHNNLGVALQQLGDDAACAIALKQAVTLDPNYLDALNNYGAALLRQERYAEAIGFFDRAITLSANHADAHYNRGTAMQSLTQFDEADASFKRAIAIKPDYYSALFNSGLLRLLRGEFEQGWRLYEYRWEDKQAKDHKSTFRHPLWLNDVDIKGKTILLHTEQGLGDFIQFCRYSLMVEKLGAKIMLSVPTDLLELAQSLSPNFEYLPIRIGKQGLTSKTPFEYQCPLLSLPLAFNTTLETIPTPRAYLKVPAYKQALWQSNIAALESTNTTKADKPVRVGLVWSGSVGHLNDAKRSLTLATLAPYLPAHLTYYVLQKEIRPHDAQTLIYLQKTHTIYTHCEQLETFTDTAALIETLDVVISVDTSVAHLAGAIDKALWVLLPFFPDFRWLMDRDDSPWYPSARLFRQKALNDWSQPLHAIQTALNALAPQSTFAEKTNIKLSNTPAVDLHVKIQAALAKHQAGQLPEAQAEYTQILLQAPENTETLTLLASLYLQQNKLNEAKLTFEKSLKIDDKNQLTLHNYALLLEKCDQNTEALRYLDLALAINPLYEDAYKHKANLLKKIGRQSEVIQVYEAAIYHKISSADLYFRYANLLRELKLDEDALRAIDQALEINPNFAQAHNNRGNILLDLKQPKEALKCYEAALRLKPNYANAISNMANAHLALNHFEAALNACDNALAIDGTLLATLNNRANALQKLHRFDEALAAYDQIISHNKDYAFAPLNKGLLCLLRGNFAEGWPLYEWRWKSSPQIQLLAIFKQPLWQGEEISNKVIFLHGEQGLGDTLQFSRYAALTAARGAKTVYLSVPKSLFNVIAHSLTVLIKNTETHDATQAAVLKKIRVLTDGDAIPTFDYQCPLLSLPLAFKTDLTSIPAETPYLFADDAHIKSWQQRLKNLMQIDRHIPRIGIVWSGSVAFSNDSNRSIALAVFKELFALNAEFHCLQKEIKADDQAVFDALFATEVTQNCFAHQTHLNDFADTAALIHHMDLVISVDTSVAHLAAAMGKPTWLLLPFVPDFRWLLNREDSPWYPAAKLFRQPSSGDWASVMTSLKAAIAQRFNIQAMPDSVPKAAIRSLPTIVTQPTLVMQGKALADKGLFAEAIAVYTQAISQEPDNTIAYNNLGVALQKKGDYAAALDAYNQAITRNPNYPSPNLNKAFLSLLLGDFTTGWHLYEWRWKDAQWRADLRTFTAPLWLGETTKASKITHEKTSTLLVYPEQGLGDYLHFCRYLRLFSAKKPFEKIIAEVPVALLQLVQASFAGYPHIHWLASTVLPDATKVTAPDIHFDAQCPLLSLPLAFNTTLENVPSEMPYLQAPQKNIAHINALLAPKTKPRVGVVWAGSNAHGNASQRNIALNDLCGLLQLNDFEFHILQKELGRDAPFLLNMLKGFGANIHTHAQNKAIDFSDFGDTAALITQMDLVITVDTAVVHLAGAMGKPVWILLPFMPDFRWLLNRSDSPWYPSARLFRQTTAGDWASVIKDVMNVLKADF